MAVEARHFNPFHPQFVHNNRQLMNGIDEHINMYGGLLPPLSRATTETFLPVYGTSVADSFPTKPQQLQTDSDFMHTLPVSRKRSRGDLIYQYQQFPNHLNNFSFLGEDDISFLIQYQQFEIDNFISQHTEKIRSEIEEHRKPSSRRIIAAVEDVIVKKLKSKQEELDRTVKLNAALQEKAKSLYIENQFWRELAQSTEAKANALRTNLQQVLHYREKAADVSEDAESCCDSNAEDDGEEEEGNGGNKGMWCRKCGKEESCVLLLPCRHLCVCSVCESSVSDCPVCRSPKNASLVVKMF